MAGIGGVVVQFRAKADQAIRETKKLTNSLGGVDGAARKAGGGLKKGLAVGAIAAGAAVTGAGVALVKFGEMAIADAASASRMKKSIQNLTKATDAQIDSLESWITQQGIAKGVADDELRPALARLVRSTGSVEKAQKLATLAIDISAATGKDYQVVANGLAKANDGQVTALRKLGITLGDSAENAIFYEQAMDRLLLTQNDAKAAFTEYGPASKEYKSAMDRVAAAQSQVNALASSGIDWQKELTKEFKGQGEEQASTVEGTWESIKLILSEGQEALGGVVLAPLERLAEWFRDPKHVEEAADFIAGLGDAAYKAGEDFVAWVDGTMVPAAKRMFDYLGSPEGKENIKTIADSILALGRVLKFFAEWAGKATAAADKLPSWLKGNPITAGKELWNNRPTQFGGRPVATPSKPLPRGGPRDSRGKTTRPSRSSSGVTIINNYPKPEKSSVTIARDLRLAKALR